MPENWQSYHELGTGAPWHVGQFRLLRTVPVCRFPDEYKPDAANWPELGQYGADRANWPELGFYGSHTADEPGLGRHEPGAAEYEFALAPEPHQGERRRT